MVVLLHAVVLVAHTIIQREALGRTETVLSVRSPIPIAVTTPIGGRLQRRSHRAGCARCQIAVDIKGARQLALRIDSRLETNELASSRISRKIGQIVEAVLRPCTKLLHCLRVSAVRIVQLYVGNPTSELHGVPALGPAKVVLGLYGILRSADR